MAMSSATQLVSESAMDGTEEQHPGVSDVPLEQVVDMMRAMSRITDPQELVRDYGSRMRQMLRSDGRLSLSRRGLAPRKYRITRSHLFPEDHNPWKLGDRLPIYESGILGDLIHDGVPRVITDLVLDPADPAIEHLRGNRSLLAIPLYDQGESLNMVVSLGKRPGMFHEKRLSEYVWLSNLFGRATHNLVLKDELGKAYAAVDRELKSVAEIQRSLLPAELPAIEGVDLAVHYRTSRRAGGDYYDFFPLPGGRWGLFIADVSGHGTPAAVLMAVTHSIAHSLAGDPYPPSRLMCFVNRQLCARYTNGNGTFVTAFYGVYDPALRQLSYCSGGHCVPRLRRGQSVMDMESARHLPLGIDPEEKYSDGAIILQKGDALVLYTDGITEARDAGGDLFGVERLDAALKSADNSAKGIVDRIVSAVDGYSGTSTTADDQTLVVARLRQ